MKSRTRPWLAALSVLLPGALGLAVIGRTFADYWARDPLAAGIVALMGIALLAGLIDLLVRQQRMLVIARELAVLPQSPSEATVDGASPLLAGMLRARLEQAPAPGFGESIAPFLTGLLVMLGLLGTLLGLFETVRGAGRALVASGDVEALRRSLATPIDGLTRSFGCSAAGISASAMLGLCLAIVRRREARVLRAVQVYALGPLRALSPTRRQARALEQLTSQGLALPQAAGALEQVGKQLEALAQRLVGGADAALAAQGQVMEQLGVRLTAAQEAATAAQGRTLTLLSGQLGAQQEAALSSHERVLRSVGEVLIGKQDTALAAQERALAVLLGGLREALEHAAARAGETLHAQVAPLVHETVEKTAEALSHQAAMLAEATQSVGSALAADAAARRDESAALITSLQARMDEAMRARMAAHEAELEKLTELARRPLAESEARERAIAGRSAELAAQLSESVRLLREAEAQQEARLGDLATRLGNDLGGLAESLREESTARIANERAHDERAQRAMERLAASAAMLDESCGRQSEAIERLVAEVPPMLGDAAASAQRGAQEGVSRLVQTTDDRLGKMSELISRELDGRLAREKAEIARAQGALDRLERGAALLESSMGRQGEVLEALVTRVAGLFEAHAAATQQSAEEALRQLLASAEAQAARFDQQAMKTQENAEATLSLMAEGAEAQAARFTQLEASLADNRSEHARGLAAQLSEHAALLEQKLGASMDAVREAAGTWQATSVEMQAVAELFAKSVERQREASDAWLESLGEVEGAVEQAGRSAAADALSDQLASTQEVFARQLQFQRELFDQLRALRTAGGGHGANRNPSGEHDVSV